MQEVENTRRNIKSNLDTSKSYSLAQDYLNLINNLLTELHQNHYLIAFPFIKIRFLAYKDESGKYLTNITTTPSLKGIRLKDNMEYGNTKIPYNATAFKYVQQQMSNNGWFHLTQDILDNGTPITLLKIDL